MPDFNQEGIVTTLHDLRTPDHEHLGGLLREATQSYKIGLVLPVTASDMRAAPFDNIVDKLRDADYIDTVCVVLNRAPDEADYLECAAKLAHLGDQAHLLWCDGPIVTGLYETLRENNFHLPGPGKGRSVWTAFGYLLGDPRLKAFVLHDCDIVDYDLDLLDRLCLPMAHPSLDFDYCKAYYARVTDRMHGRVVRLLVSPLLKALISVLGYDKYLVYMSSFRYPLAGEFAISSMLARSNRIPSDWGLEVGTLAEVYRNTSLKRVCQVDLCRMYEHKHQELSIEDPGRGLMKMANDILTSIFRTLASMGHIFSTGTFSTLRSAYLRCAQDAIRQYHADALINNLQFDRHAEEQAVEGFADQITVAGQTFLDDPSGGEAIPNWTRVLTTLPDFPQQLRQSVKDEAKRLKTAEVG